MVTIKIPLKEYTTMVENISIYKSARESAKKDDSKWAGAMVSLLDTVIYNDEKLISQASL